MKIPFNKTRFFDQTTFNGNSYLDKKDGKGFDVFTVHCLSRHPKHKLSGASRVYFIIEGSGTFTVNDAKEAADQFDLFLVENGDTFEYEGDMKLFSFTILTDSSNEEKLE